MSDPLPTQITFSSDVIFQVIDDEAVILDMVSEEYFAINELGKRMWQLLSSNSNIDAAIQQLLLEYDVEEPALRQDMAAWIDQLVDLGLVVVGEA
jgi:hypothetical protein